MAGKHVTGVEVTLRGMDKMTEGLSVNIHDGLVKIAWMVYKRSQHYVPVDTQALKKSGQVREEGKGFGARAYVTYGESWEARAPYALWVHENLQAYHKPPTRAKYLAQAVRDTRANAERILNREVGAKLQKFIDNERVA